MGGAHVSPSFRSRLSVAIAAAVLCTLAGDSAVLADRQRKPAVPRSVAIEQHLVRESDATAARHAKERDDAIRTLFDARAEAVRKRDRKKFLAGLDPDAKEFRAHQNVVFDSLGKLSFADWTYSVKDGESYSVTGIDYQKYQGADDLWLPVLILRYRLKDFDVAPVGRRVVYTVVRRGSHWYIANDADLEDVTSSGTSVRVDPWENGPIIVARSKHGIVIGHPDDAKAVAGIQREVESAVTHVTSFVGKLWGERVVVVLPADHDELNRVLENPEVPFDFAAIARPLSTTPGDDSFREFAGSRVVINPDGFHVGRAFTRILIRHEITHVALFDRTGPLSPKWLVEGIAEYVGNAGAPYPPARLGADLGELIDKSGVPDHLPSDSDFGLINDAGIGYNSGWLLCRYIASKYGRAKLFALYDEMGTLTGLSTPGTKLANALSKLLHITEAKLLRDWKPYVRAAVADLTNVLTPPAGYTEDDTGELDPADIADEKNLSEKQLVATGVERAGEGVWYLGNDAAHPAKLAVETIVVSRDETAAAGAERLLASRFRKIDPTGRPTAHGRLYYLGVTIGGRDYNVVAAILRTGTVVVEVRVAVPIYGDPTAEVVRLAQRQYAAVAT
jgi:hypothetical protein